MVCGGGVGWRETWVRWREKRLYAGSARPSIGTLLEKNPPRAILHEMTVYTMPVLLLAY